MGLRTIAAGGSSSDRTRRSDGASRRNEETRRLPAAAARASAGGEEEREEPPEDEGEAILHLRLRPRFEEEADAGGVPLFRSDEEGRVSLPRLRVRVCSIGKEDPNAVRVPSLGRHDEGR